MVILLTVFLALITADLEGMRPVRDGGEGKGVRGCMHVLACAKPLSCSVSGCFVRLLLILHDLIK